MTGNAYVVASCSMQGTWSQDRYINHNLAYMAILNLLAKCSRFKNSKIFVTMYFKSLVRVKWISSKCSCAFFVSSALKMPQLLKAFIDKTIAIIENTRKLQNVSLA